MQIQIFHSLSGNDDAESRCQNNNGSNNNDNDNNNTVGDTRIQQSYESDHELSTALMGPTTRANVGDGDGHVGNNNTNNNSIDNNDDQTTKIFSLFNVITCTFLICSFIIAMSISDLGIILGIVGATGSTIVSYILPGAVYIKLHPYPHILRSLAYVQLILGVIIVPTALYFVIFKGGTG